MSGDEAPRTSCHPKASPGECATPKTPREMRHPKNPRGNVPPQSPPRESATPKPPRLQRGHSVAALLSLQTGGSWGKSAPKSPLGHALLLCYKALQISRSSFQQLHHHGPGEANEALGGAERAQDTAPARQNAGDGGEARPGAAIPAPPAPFLSKIQPRAGPGLRKTPRGVSAARPQPKSFPEVPPGG